MKLIDESGFSLITTPMHALISSKIYQDCVEEEIRVLYVALTRAREQLFITGTARSSVTSIKEKTALRSLFFDRYTTVSQCKSYLDWILLALADKEYSFSKLEYLTPENKNHLNSNILTPPSHVFHQSSRSHVSIPIYLTNLTQAMTYSSMSALQLYPNFSHRSNQTRALPSAERQHTYSYSFAILNMQQLTESRKSFTGSALLNIYRHELRN